jgi:hypothetical protein
MKLQLESSYPEPNIARVGFFVGITSCTENADRINLGMSIYPLFC